MKPTFTKPQPFIQNSFACGIIKTKMKDLSEYFEQACSRQFAKENATVKFGLVKRYFYVNRKVNFTRILLQHMRADFKFCCTDLKYIIHLIK